MPKINSITIIQSGENKCTGVVRKFLYANLTCATIAAAIPDGINIQIVDMFIQDLDYNNIKGQLALITTNTPDFPTACEVSRRLREMGIPTIIGGVHAHACPDECTPYFDAVAIGEAELLMEDIIKDFDEGKLKTRYTTNGFFDLKKSKIPRYDLLMLRKYVYFPIMASKGCAFDCDFCSSRLITGPEFRFKTVEQVISEIKYFRSLNEKDPLTPASFYFVDSNLYTNRKFLIELINALIPLKLNQWGLFASVNIAYDDEVLELLSQANCTSIQMGFESVRPLVLKSINKIQNDPRRYGEIIDRLADKGIRAHATFIFGFDADDDQVFEETSKAIADTNLAYAGFFTLTPYPATRIYQKLSEEGRLLHHDWCKYNMSNLVFKPANMTPEQLESGIRMVREVVNDPDRILKCLEVFAQKSGKKLSLSFVERIILRFLYIFMSSKLNPPAKKIIKRAAAGKTQTTFQDIMELISIVQSK